MYRESTVPTCAECGVRLHRAQTYFDGDGRQLCLPCHHRVSAAVARERVAGTRREDTIRSRRAYVLARVLVAVGLLFAAWVMSALSHR